MILRIYVDFMLFKKIDIIFLQKLRKIVLKNKEILYLKGNRLY